MIRRLGQRLRRGSAASKTTADGRRRYDELDGIRGLAAIAIVVFHAYQDSRIFGYEDFIYRDDWWHPLIRSLDGSLAFFFALSGFVIFLPWARAALDGRRYSLGSYASRRAFRILPLYLIVMFMVWDFRYYGGPGQWKELLYHLSFLQIYDNERIFYINGPAWSLAAEVHFYIFAGLLGAWCVRKARRRSAQAALRLMVAVPLLAIVASEAAKTIWYLQGVPFDSYVHWYSALARVDTFAMGMLLAVWWAHRTQEGREPVKLKRRWTGIGVWVIVSLGLVFARIGEVDVREPLEPFFYPLCAIGCVALIAAIITSPPDWWVMKIFRFRPLFRIGVLSYSVYLLHEPILIALDDLGLMNFADYPSWAFVTFVYVIVCVLAAEVTYRLIELPGQQARDVLARVYRRSAPAAETVRRRALRNTTRLPWHGDLPLSNGDVLTAWPSGSVLVGSIAPTRSRFVDEMAARPEPSEVASLRGVLAAHDLVPLLIISDPADAVEGVACVLDPDMTIRERLGLELRQQDRQGVYAEGRWIYVQDGIVDMSMAAPLTAVLPAVVDRRQRARERKRALNDPASYKSYMGQAWWKAISLPPAPDR